ncbi:MAG TPA: AAA family ATPase, partial [Armatimonadota bacterium]
MKPLVLTIDAFGPFATRQVLDFRLLDDRSLFLIHGPTGAGKSTILDAMCFALYGETSGGERKGQQMRCHQAEPNVATEVTFDFAIGAERYRVWRRPEQSRPKLRGEGVRVDGAQATLWHRTDCREDAEEGAVIAAQANKVTVAVEDVLGFKVAQFRQVVMLPQGQFRAWLLSSSSEREVILQSLFQTQVYQRITDELKRVAKTLEGELRDSQQRRVALLEQAGVATVEALHALLAQRQGELADMAAQVLQARQCEQDAAHSLSETRTVLARLQERDAAQAALVALQAECVAIERLQDEIATIRKAIPLATQEADLQQRVREAEEAAHRAVDAHLGQKTALERSAHAQAAFIHEQGRAPEREAAQQTLHALQGLAVKVAELSEALAAQRHHRQVHEAQEQRCCALRQQTIHLRQALQDHQDGLDQVEADAGQLTAYRMALRDIERQYGLRQELDKACQAWQIGNAELTERLAVCAQADERLTQLREDALRLQQLWDAGQAAHLARELRPDTPCPVCGATHHPTPAQAEGVLPESAELDALRAAIEAQAHAVSQLREAAMTQQQHVARCDAEIQLCVGQLGELRDVETTLLATHCADARERVAMAEAAAMRATELQLELDALRAQQAALDPQLALADAQRADVARLYEQATVLQDERARAIPEAYRDAQALAEATRQAQAQYDALCTQWESAQTTWQDAQQACIAWDERSTLAEANVRRVSEVVESERRTFETNLLADGFVSAEAFREACQVIPALDAKVETVRTFADKLAAVKDRAARASRAAEGLLLPDLVTVENVAHESRCVLDTLLRDEAQRRQDFSHLTALGMTLDELTASASALDARYAVIGHLADIASGRNGAGMTFQRFVLAALLDDVLLVASKRLLAMSRGRYTLHRVTTRTDQRQTSGLDLEVFDAYTGTARPVATLSGGESFLASLALALGLADVVQSYAGGIHLATVFIDEGFG